MRREVPVNCDSRLLNATTERRKVLEIPAGGYTVRGLAVAYAPHARAAMVVHTTRRTLPRNRCITRLCNVRSTPQPICKGFE